MRDKYYKSCKQAAGGLWCPLALRLFIMARSDRDRHELNAAQQIFINSNHLSSAPISLVSARLAWKFSHFTFSEMFFSTVLVETNDVQIWSCDQKIVPNHKVSDLIRMGYRGSDIYFRGWLIIGADIGYFYDTGCFYMYRYEYFFTYICISLFIIQQANCPAHCAIR